MRKPGRHRRCCHFTTNCRRHWRCTLTLRLQACVPGCLLFVSQAQTQGELILANPQPSSARLLTSVLGIIGVAACVGEGEWGRDAQ